MTDLLLWKWLSAGRWVDRHPLTGQLERPPRRDLHLPNRARGESRTGRLQRDEDAAARFLQTTFEP